MGLKAALKKQRESYKSLGRAQKINLKIFIAVLLISGFMLYSASRTGTSGVNEADISMDISTDNRVSSASRTEHYSTISDSSYAQSLRDAERERSEEARRQGRTTHLQDIANLEWSSDGDERDADDIDGSWFDDTWDDRAPQGAQQNPREETSRERAERARREAMARRIDALNEDGTISGDRDAFVSQYGQSEERERRQREQEEREAREQAERAARERASAARRNDPRPMRNFSREEEADYMRSKQQAANSLISSLNNAPSSATYTYELEGEPEEFYHTQAIFGTGGGSRVAGRDSGSGGGLSGDVRGRTSATLETRGFVPGDRLIGFTRMPINSDTTSWVDVEIASGPLRGAVVSLTPSRVEGEVVLAANSLTFERYVSTISAIAVNPNEEMSTGFSTSTNHRRMARYGSAFASRLLGTAVDLISSQSRTQSSLDGSIIQNIEFNRDQILAASLAGGGEEVLSDVRAVAQSRPPTVRVEEGHRVILIMTEGQEIEWLPDDYILRRAVN